MILRRICQLSLTRITHQVSPAFDLNAGMFVKYGKEYEEICRRTGHKTEPYVYSQMIAGADAPRFGEAKNSWLTGTAAWTFVNLSQALLGI